MPVTEKLSLKLYETFGGEAAAEMVNWMHRVEAQRTELRELNELNFARFDARFNEIDARFGRIDARFNEMEARFGQIDARFNEMEARFGQIDARFNEMEAKFGQIDARFNEMEARFGQMDERFGRLEASIIGRLEAKIEQRFADLMKWSFVFWVGAVGAVAILAGVLR